MLEPRVNAIRCVRTHTPAVMANVQKVVISRFFAAVSVPLSASDIVHFQGPVVELIHSEIIRLWHKQGVSFAGHTFWPGRFVDYDEA